MDARYVLPEFTERTSFGTRTLDPYSKLLESRIVFLGTPVDETSANDAIAQFLYLDHAAPGQDISLYINSPGGSISAMTSIYDTMRTLSCDVETTCLGQAVSTAAVLLAAGTPGKRLILPGARVTLRQPTLEEPLQGQLSDLDLQAAELLRLRALVAGMLAEHTGQDRERIDADTDRLTVLDAPAAVAYGLADHVVVNRRAAVGGTDR
ncbi:ATP-dependent Clp protease proteolytic subunit [Streptomyces venezuelae]|uniref:ATP-dependent Clp protease proteolytic subunit n=1 Tax=Streptomyces gardneri TaxID=66892 RepID=UPI0006BC946F|nr:ATP-dependent Clp protease proteolytic subunit [Streptomyces gardneri]ALO06832.1 ATP-dependent Clp protease proteolytic subunit [Streptomyces venezuelae]QPK44219.1 ATP-dependent Clp protease proteolytic subunit [Streptomyces gardneri]WRK35501.1 ATP-dependent Clp protease proteolytic subunit [Streptomyces venezuelae]CUM42873.1 ATP-dependent Clp protease proteolytic subunit [Streptomyces venezuelae]